MVKILVVDDLLADRRSIISLLKSFHHLSIQITAEAENGLQALEQIEVNRPDIVISDIEMPLCNGFELARNIRALYPDIKIIFCSLYDEFEYARQALYFGGYGYILKPLDPNELDLCIQRITGEISDEALEKHRHHESEEIRSLFSLYQPVLAQNLYKEILYGVPLASVQGLIDRLGYLRLDLAHGPFMVAYFEIDDFESITGAENFEQRQVFSLRICRRVQEILASDGNLAFAILDDAHFAVIMTFSNHDLSELSRRAYDACTRVLIDFLKSDVSLTISLSRTCESISEVGGLYQQCLYQMKHKYQLGKGKVIMPQDVPSTRTVPDLDFNTILKEVRFLLNSGTLEEIAHYIDDLFTIKPLCAGEAYLKNQCYYLVICAQIVINENNETFYDVYHSEIHVWEKLAGFETIEDAAAWIKEIMILSNEYLAVKSSTTNAQIVERVKKYIESNYIKNISLEEMAADLFYSANYINRIFKQVTGETIFNYASNIRIEKAKEMLLDPKIKLSSISEALGYSNPAYFGYIFKKAAGLTPKEYRERKVR
jgi:YesN/AraC family two-component response regulator